VLTFYQFFRLLLLLLLLLLLPCVLHSSFIEQARARPPSRAFSCPTARQK